MRLAPCTIKDANRFVALHHRHSRAIVGGLWATAAEHDGEVVGVAIVGRPIARRLQDGKTVECLRCCVLPDAPRNTCSFLYGAVRRQAGVLGWSRILTYTLARESGASLRGAGWLPFVAHTGGQWSVPSRPRKNLPISDEPKVRWESRTAPHGRDVVANRVARNMGAS